MFTSEAVDTAARSLLDRRKADAFRVRGGSENWCSDMRTGDDDSRRDASPVIDPVCGKLRALFDEVTLEPMPDQLERLAQKLDAALERGDLGARRK
jgi:hypothetical protein